MTRAIHQFHPTLAAGDAVSDDVFALRDLFRSWGYASEAYAVEAKPEVRDQVVPYRRLFRVIRPDDLLLLHFSIGSEIFDPLARLGARRVLVYHNVTPPEFFDGINPHTAAFAERGLRQLAGLAPRVDLAIGVSEFNRKALEDVGFPRTAVVPVLVDWRRYDVAPDAAVLAEWEGPRTKLLFVGRVSPNKRQDDLIRMLAYYRTCLDPAGTLLLVGAYRDQPQYHGRLRALARQLGVEGGVTFAGKVSLAALVAYYRVASVFVSLSEHEGFGVPLLEAMRFGVPVVAYAAGALADTVAGGGLLLRERDLAVAAETCALVVARPELRAALVEGGRRRVEDFSAERVAARVREVLEL